MSVLWPQLPDKDICVVVAVDGSFHHLEPGPVVGEDMGERDGRYHLPRLHRLVVVGRLYHATAHRHLAVVEAKPKNMKLCLKCSKIFN